MSDSDSNSSIDIHRERADSLDNTNNNNIKTNPKKEENNTNQMSKMINNNNEEDEFQIENNEITNQLEKKEENDSLIQLNNNINNDTNNKKNIEEKKKEEKQIIDLNLNIGNSLSSLKHNKKKDVIYLKIDEEQSKKNKCTMYQLLEYKDNSNLYSNDEKDVKNNYSILCRRRYSEFDKFYNTLKFRYPHCIFPRLSGKKILNNDEPIFVENRRKELQYFINKLYFHEEISKSEEFKKFIYESSFENKYYSNLPKRYHYPECEKANNEKGYFSLGMNKIKGFFGNTKEHKQSEDEKEILKREEEFINKDNKYNELIKELRNLYESAEETRKQYGIISNNFLYLKGNNNKDYEKEEEYKNNLSELIDLNQNFSNIYGNNNKNYLLDLIDQLNYCILDVEGINRAIERFNNFIKEYEKVKNTKSSNKFVAEEQSKIEKDKEEFERFVLKDLKKYDKENKHIYEDIIAQLIFYIQKINGEELETFNNSNFN